MESFGLALITGSHYGSFNQHLSIPCITIQNAYFKNSGAVIGCSNMKQWFVIGRDNPLPICNSTITRGHNLSGMWQVENLVWPGCYESCNARWIASLPSCSTSALKRYASSWRPKLPGSSLIKEIEWGVLGFHDGRRKSSLRHSLRSCNTYVVLHYY